MACDNCKVRKVKCCGSRPCSACRRQNLLCEYSEGKERAKTNSSRLARIRGREQAILSRNDQHSTPMPDGFANGWMSSPLSWDSLWTPISGDGSAASSSDPSTSFGDISQRLSEAALIPHPHILSTMPQLPIAHVSPDTIPHQSSSPTAIQSRPAAADLGGSASSAPTHMVSRSSSSIHTPSIEIPDIPWRFIPSDPLLQGSTDVWPKEVVDISLLPWLASYFERLAPIVPILSRPLVYEDMLLGRHKRDPDFGAMILSMCCIVMVQCVFSEETSQLRERTKAARELMQHLARMRASWDFGQNPTYETILTSFFLFGTLFSDGQQHAAWHQLKLAVDMSRQIGLDVPDVIPLHSKHVRELRVRIYLALAVTERACALMRRQNIGLRGRPWSVTLSAQQMSMFFENSAVLDDTPSPEIQGLLYLANLFDTIDEGLLNCWEGWCHKTDGVCDATDRRQILTVTKRVMTIGVNMDSSAKAINEAQKTDILITQLWILNRIWHLSRSHSLLHPHSEHPMLTSEFGVALACAAAAIFRQHSPHSFEVHGMGMLEKLDDLAIGVRTAKTDVGEAAIAAYVEGGHYVSALGPCVELWQRFGVELSPALLTMDAVVAVLGEALRGLRAGSHPYTKGRKMT